MAATGQLAKLRVEKAVSRVVPLGRSSVGRVSGLLRSSFCVTHRQVCRALPAGRRRPHGPDGPDGRQVYHKIWASTRCEVAQILFRVERQRHGLRLRDPAGDGRSRRRHRCAHPQCSALTSLPERLGECKALQTLYLGRCEALTSLPDLSGLEQLEVTFLPGHLKPWQDSGYKAFSVAS